MFNKYMLINRLIIYVFYFLLKIRRIGEMIFEVIRKFKCLEFVYNLKMLWEWKWKFRESD